MYAHVGMKIEEWEDGQVNIGVAVCPTKPTAISSIAATENERNDMLMSHSNFVVIPKSAFIIRPPEQYQSQGGISFTYARKLNRPSKFIIMLNPQDQGYQDTTIRSQDQSLSHTQQRSSDITLTENMEPIENGISSDKSRLDSTIPEKVDQDDKNRSDQPSLQDEQQEKERNKSSSSKESSDLITPQKDTVGTTETNSKSLEATTLQEKATGSLEKEASSIPIKRSGDMKRVSWVEDTEQFEDKKGSGKSSKENKKDSLKKSNGKGNNNSRNSSTKKHQGFSSEDVSSTNAEGYTKGSKRSGDRSRIPLISASAGDNPALSSCEFYRRQMLRECMYDPPPSMADNWYGYTSIQKYAGQKVVKKIAEEQKRLEEDISNRRKTEIWILGNNETDDFILSPSPSVPLRKRTTRLKPMQFVQ